MKILSTEGLTKLIQLIKNSFISIDDTVTTTTTDIKTVNNTSLLGSGNIDTSEIFIAEYGTTTYQEVLDAYNVGKTIVCNLSAFRCLTITYNQILNQFKFSGITSDNLSNTGILLDYIILDSSDNWSIIHKELADTDLSNLSTTGQAVIDAKVNTSDIWYDSTSSTLYIGVSQS